MLIDLLKQRLICMFVARFSVPGMLWLYLHFTLLQNWLFAQSWQFGFGVLYFGPFVVCPPNPPPPPLET